MERIRNVSCCTVDLIESYTEEGRESRVSHITALSPPIGKVQDVISIKGKFLPPNGDSKNKSIVIAIDHKPIITDVTTPALDEVHFTVPQAALGANVSEASVWISVVDNGVETNALPFQIVRSA